jgi:hypothetical protein
MDSNLQKQLSAPLGSGMAQRAGQQLTQVPMYKDYAIQMQTNGIDALPQSDPNWMQHYQQMMQQMEGQMPQGLLSQSQ